jgi:hypothetical protein
MVGRRFYNRFWHPLVLLVCEKYNQGQPTFLTSELAAMFLANRDEVVLGATMALTKYDHNPVARHDNVIAPVAACGSVQPSLAATT